MKSKGGAITVSIFIRFQSRSLTQNCKFQKCKNFSTGKKKKKIYIEKGVTWLSLWFMKYLTSNVLLFTLMKIDLTKIKIMFFGFAHGLIYTLISHIGFCIIYHILFIYKHFMNLFIRLVMILQVILLFWLQKLNSQIMVRKLLLG